MQPHPAPCILTHPPPIPSPTPPPALQTLNKPDDEEVERVAAETAAALALRVDKKQASINPKTLPAAPGAAQYIKYTPADGGPQHASGAATRIIKMQDAAVDPLEPPKFRHIKVRVGGVCVCVLLGVGGVRWQGCAWGAEVWGPVAKGHGTGEGGAARCEAQGLAATPSPCTAAKLSMPPLRACCCCCCRCRAAPGRRRCR